MAKNFAALAFTKDIKDLQEKYGSRVAYERMEKQTFVDGLTEDEIMFIANQDSFYMASIGENNYPYIQHRGGPKGFVKVLDKHTLGFIDFTGNKQYITLGNLANNTNISLFMMNYPLKARLKLLGKAEVIELQERTELYNQLNLSEYQFKPERMFLLHIEAYDWNCPQHITPRYALQELETAMAPQRAYIKKLEEEIKKLKEQK